MKDFTASDSNLSDILVLKKEFDALQPFKTQEQAPIVQDFRLDWNYHSNQLLDNSLTYEECKNLIFSGITANGKLLNDHLEIIKYDLAIQKIWALDSKNLNSNFIVKLYHLLVLKFDILSAGKQAFQISTGTPSPDTAIPKEIIEKIEELTLWYNQQLESADLNPVHLAAELYTKWLRIKPFTNHNHERMAQVLMNLALHQQGFPPIVIKMEDQKKYAVVLQKASSDKIKEEQKPFLSYLQEQLYDSSQKLLSGLKRNSQKTATKLEDEIAQLEQRLANIGEPRQLTLSSQNQWKLFGQTIFPMIEKLVDRSTLLEKFYLKTTYKFWTRHKAYQFFKGDIPETIKKKLVRSIDSTLLETEENFLTVEINFGHFNRTGLGDFGYKTKLFFTFHELNYEVKGIAREVRFKKSYSEQLREEEIEELVNSEIRIHKEFIEQKIENM